MITRNRNRSSDLEREGIRRQRASNYMPITCFRANNKAGHTSLGQSPNWGWTRLHLLVVLNMWPCYQIPYLNIEYKALPWDHTTIVLVFYEVESNNYRCFYCFSGGKLSSLKTMTVQTVISDNEIGMRRRGQVGNIKVGRFGEQGHWEKHLSSRTEISKF